MPHLTPQEKVIDGNKSYPKQMLQRIVTKNTFALLRKAGLRGVIEAGTGALRYFGDEINEAMKRLPREHIAREVEEHELREVR